jgi:hypothetical protein
MDEVEAKEYTMTLHMAEEKLNQFMSAFDLRHKDKWFVVSKDVTITTTTSVDEKYIRAIIERSRQGFFKEIERAKVDFWIPAITYLNKFYKDPSVKVLSDGVREYFVGNNETFGKQANDTN